MANLMGRKNHAGKLALAALECRYTGRGVGIYVHVCVCIWKSVRGGHIYDVFSQHRCMEQGFLTYNEMKILPTTCRVEYPSSAGINYICIMNPYYDFPYSCSLLSLLPYSLLLPK